MGQYMGIFKIKRDSIELFKNEFKALPEHTKKISTTEFINLYIKKIHYKVIPCLLSGMRLIT